VRGHADRRGVAQLAHFGGGFEQALLVDEVIEVRELTGRRGAARLAGAIELTQAMIRESNSRLRPME
jgi:hypothetical protein